MNLKTIKIVDPKIKSQICDNILRHLPNWFGLEDSIVEYVHECTTMPFYAVFAKGKCIGFVALKIHNKDSAEIHVMGVLSEYHRKGIGRILVNKCEAYAKTNSIKFLSAKTLDSSKQNEFYKRTRAFYLSLGFVALMQIDIWDSSNPCLLLTKIIL